MASFKIVFKKSVEKDLRRIDKSQVPRIVAAIAALAQNPRPVASKKLVGSDSSFRLRVGDYRVVYLIFDRDRTIEIQRVGHRKEIYR